MAGEEKRGLEQGSAESGKKSGHFDIVDFILGLLGLKKRGGEIGIKPEAPGKKPATLPAIKRPARRKAGQKKKKTGKIARGKKAKKRRAEKLIPEREEHKTSRIAKPAAGREKAGGVPKLPEAIRVVYESAERDEGAIEGDISTTKKLLERIENQFFRREISEEEYRKRKSELEEKLFVLEEKRKGLQKNRLQLAKYAQTQKEEGRAKTEIAQITAKMQGLEQDFSSGKISEEAYGGTKAAYESRLFELKRKARKVEGQRISAEKEVLGGSGKKEGPGGIIAKPGKGAGAEEGPAGMVELPKGITAKPGGKIEVPEMRRKPAEKRQKPAEKAVPETEKPIIEKLMEAKASGTIDEGKLKELEGHIRELMKTYNIPEGEIEKEIGGIRADHALEDAEKLIDLMELEHRAQGLEGTEHEEAKREEAKAVIKEIKKHRIVTDFDRILQLVNERGKIKTNDAIKELGIQPKRMDEVVEILEREGLVKIEYSAVGSAWIFSPEYKKPVQEKGKKKAVGAEAKPGAAKPEVQKKKFSFIEALKIRRPENKESKKA